MIVTFKYDDTVAMIDLYQEEYYDVQDLDQINEEWNKRVKEAVKLAETNYIPLKDFKEYLFEILEDEDIEWRYIVSEYLFEINED